MCRGTIGPAPGGGSASAFFSERLGEHVLVERQVGDQLLQAPILVLDLPQPAQLADSQVGVLPFPEVERRLAEAPLPTDIRHGGPALGLAQGKGDLLLGELRALHGGPSLSVLGTGEANPL